MTRKELMAMFLKQLTTRGLWRFRATSAQLKAGAKKMADMYIANERRFCDGHAGGE